MVGRAADRNIIATGWVVHTDWTLTARPDAVRVRARVAEQLGAVAAERPVAKAAYPATFCSKIGILIELELVVPAAGVAADHISLRCTDPLTIFGHLF